MLKLHSASGSADELAKGEYDSGEWLSLLLVEFRRSRRTGEKIEWARVHTEGPSRIRGFMGAALLRLGSKRSFYGAELGPSLVVG